MILSLLTSKIGLSLIIVTILSSGAYGVYSYIQYQEKQINALTSSIKDVKIANIGLKTSLEAQQANFEYVQVMAKKLETQEKANRAERQKLSDILVKHDLTYLASKKPGLIEKTINRATKKINNELNGITDL